MAIQSGQSQVLRLLAVDPSGKLAADLAAALGGSAHNIVQAGSHAEAIQQLHRLEIDAVMVTHSAGDGAWRDVIGEIRAMQFAGPVIVASADIDEGLWVDALFAGASHLLRLPLDPLEARRLLQESVRRRPKYERTRRRTSHSRRYAGRCATRA
jgi:DNA-binding NtrC family response regulator